jgi:cytochrome c biogenesis protein
MAREPRSILTRLPKTLTSIRTGIVLLIIVGIVSAAGTLILQRPLTEPEQLARAYSPQTLAWLDRLGLTDVFHAWWFVVLLALLSLNIVLASLERFPVAWHEVVRPYLRPEPHFLSGLPLQKEIPIRNAESGIEAAERAFRRVGFKPQRVGRDADISLYAERHRYARLAAYVVHTSLLLILTGGMVDALWGYRGFLSLTKNEQASQIELRDGGTKSLGFTIRCDGAGQENYADGTPRRYWSTLGVLENGREVKQETIEVNKPLVYRGLRFFQSSYGPTGDIGSVRLLASSKTDPSIHKEIVLQPGVPVALDANTSVQLARFVPDFVISGNQIASRSNEPNNPAIQLSVVSKDAGESRVWLFPKFPDFPHPDNSPYAFQVRDLEMGYFTGLQVSYEPGQWAVWAGVILMGVGLCMAFYMLHIRFWAVPVSDSRGRLALWVGATASKNRDALEARFRKLVEAIEQELSTRGEAGDAIHPA